MLRDGSKCNRSIGRLASELLNQNGSYLLQVLVAIFLFSIAMLGLAQLGYASMLGNRTSQMLTEATSLAQLRIEQAKRQTFSSVDTLEKTETYGNIAGYEAFKRTTDVTQVGGANQLKRVTVTVSWDADRHSFDLQTAISW
jgi:Tfp pilus assembly protein PilV